MFDQVDGVERKREGLGPLGDGLGPLGDGLGLIARASGGSPRGQVVRMIITEQGA
jgi:hypothetical protein